MSSAPNLIGTYAPLVVQRGQLVRCLYRKAKCVVTGFSDAPIRWPRVRALKNRGGSGLWVNRELRRAVRIESAEALMHWFGVTAGVVWKWRKLFGVGGHATTRGSRAAHRAASMKGGAVARVREVTDEERARRSDTSKRLGLKPPGTGRAWTDAELALLGTASDRTIGERIGRGLHAVAFKRRGLGIAAYVRAAADARE